jgi:hypothetical protein
MVTVAGIATRLVRLGLKIDRSGQRVSTVQIRPRTPLHRSPSPPMKLNTPLPQTLSKECTKAAKIRAFALSASA